MLETILPLLSIPLLLLAYWRLHLKKLKSYHSPLLGKIDVLQKYNGEKVLNINSYPQGVSIEQPSIKQSYWYSIAEQAVTFCTARKDPNILMLGLGANTITNLIHQLNSQINLTVIELDPQIIQACSDFFNLKQLVNCQVIEADVYKMADKPKAFNQHFDVIIVDVFTGNPPFISLKSNQPTFIEKIMKWLAKDGMIIFNRPAHIREARQEGQLFQQELQKLFVQTKLFDIQDPRGFRNHVIWGQGKI